MKRHGDVPEVIKRALQQQLIPETFEFCAKTVTYSIWDDVAYVLTSYGKLLEDALMDAPRATHLLTSVEAHHVYEFLWRHGFAQGDEQSVDYEYDGGDQDETGDDGDGGNGDDGDGGDSDASIGFVLLGSVQHCHPLVLAALRHGQLDILDSHQGYCWELLAPWNDPAYRPV
ncbi:hypothetical protein ATCC90586_004622 [Pythium insidiosum]|nr:hypothetical protein ATCC90586_004622 [Pythium insidiosum]